MATPRVSSLSGRANSVARRPRPTIVAPESVFTAVAMKPLRAGTMNGFGPPAAEYVHVGAVSTDASYVPTVRTSSARMSPDRVGSRPQDRHHQRAAMAGASMLPEIDRLPR